jgi:hypothetical protein
MSTGGVRLGSSYDEARTRKVNAEAEIAELELAKVRGELVVANDVVQAWDDVLSAMKGKLMSIPTKAAPVVSAESEAGVCQKIIEDLVNEALEELSNYEPKIDPTTASSGSGEAEEATSGAKTAAKANGKRVGRPKKASGLSKQ